MPDLVTGRRLSHYLTTLPSDMLLLWLRESGFSIPLPDMIERQRAGGRSRHDAEASTKWANENQEALLPALFRIVDPPNEDVAELLPKAAFPLHASLRHLTLRICFDGRNFDHENFRGIPLTELAAASAMLTELYLDIASANMAVGLTTDPPRVVVEEGSVQFSTSGSLLAVGVGFVLACSTGLIAAPAGYLGGGFLAGVGMIDMFLGWRRTIAERDALAEQALYHRSSRLKVDVERANLQSDRRPVNIRRVQKRKGVPPRPAGSASVDRQTVDREAQRHELNSAYAHHLLNRTVRTVALIQERSKSITLKPE